MHSIIDCCQQSYRLDSVHRQCVTRRELLKLIILAIVLTASIIGTSCARANTDAPRCPTDNTISIQILGSGGPIADDGRASSSYLVWIDGKSRVLIDTGGGSFLRFGEAGAKFEDLDFIGLSHFHTDHSADFPALLKSGYFSTRRRSLAVSGPGGNSRFPGLSKYLSGMLSPAEGTYGYLGGYLTGDGRLASLDATEVDIEIDQPTLVFENPERALTVSALPVSHGIVPAVAFRVQIDNTTIVFAGDQNLANENFFEFAKNADVLVVHMPIPERADRAAKNLHATPGQLGQLANHVAPRLLVVSHFMARSLRDLTANIAAIRKKFAGEISIAEDLLCVPLESS